MNLGLKPKKDTDMIRGFKMVLCVILLIFMCIVWWVGFIDIIRMTWR